MVNAGIVEAYDRLGPTYGKISKAIGRFGELEKMREDLIRGYAWGSVLEIGIGTGANLPYYEDAYGGVRHVTGTDFSAKMLGVAESARQAISAQVPFMPVLVSEQDVGLPFPDGSFDCVVMTLVSCMLSDARTMYLEISRVLRWDGCVMFLDHVPPKSAIGRACMCMLRPLARTLLSCDPLSENISQIAADGRVVLERSQIAADGLVVLERSRRAGGPGGIFRSFVAHPRWWRT